MEHNLKTPVSSPRCSVKGEKSLSAKFFSIVSCMIAFCLCSLAGSKGSIGCYWCMLCWIDLLGFSTVHWKYRQRSFLRQVRKGLSWCFSDLDTFMVGNSSLHMKTWFSTKKYKKVVSYFWVLQPLYTFMLNTRILSKTIEIKFEEALYTYTVYISLKPTSTVHVLSPKPIWPPPSHPPMNIDDLPLWIIPNGRHFECLNKIYAVIWDVLHTPTCFTRYRNTSFFRS